MNRREAIQRIATISAAGAAGAILPRSTTAAETTATAPLAAPSAKPSLLEKNGLQFWLETSLKRVYPTSDATDTKELTIQSARNHRFSFQACFKNTKVNSTYVTCEISGADGLETKVRRVGFVPLRNLNTATPLDELEGIGDIPGLCPDPLFPENSVQIGPMANGVFWVSVYVPESVAPGPKKFNVTFKLTQEYGYASFVNPEPWTIEMPVTAEISPMVIQRRKNFPVTQWISADSIWEYYKIEPLSERFWELADKYVGNAVQHGVDVVYTPIFNIRAEKLKRPAQLLRVRKTGPDKYEFDFSDVRRWIKMAMKNDANYVEFGHFFSPAPESAAYPQKIYDRWETMGDLLWPADTPATSDIYRKFLEQFLPPFKAMLEEEGVMDKSLFHCADEPDGEKQINNYRKARAFLKEMAPWIKVMDAMSDPHFATERLSDFPVPSVSTAIQFVEAGAPAWVYFCCGPRDGFIQRLLDTPLSKIRMTGWLFFKHKALGFLHWGHNYWFYFCSDRIDDPFLDSALGHWPGLPTGDPFVVYPGADGPIDSVRWEVFAESLQDYAILQTAGVTSDDPLLADIKSYDVFPKKADWHTAAFKKVIDRKA